MCNELHFVHFSTELQRISDTKKAARKRLNFASIDGAKAGLDTQANKLILNKKQIKKNTHAPLCAP